MTQPLIIIDTKARRRFTRTLASLEDCAAEGNTWGPKLDAEILLGRLKGGVRINKRDLALLIDCVQYTRDDVAERLRDYPQDYDDHAYTQRRIDRMSALLKRLTEEDES